MVPQEINIWWMLMLPHEINIWLMLVMRILFFQIYTSVCSKVLIYITEITVATLVNEITKASEWQQRFRTRVLSIESPPF